MRFKRPDYLILALSAAFAAASLPLLAQSGANDVFQALVKREFGTAVNELTAIEKQIQSAKPEEFAAIETRLIAVIETAEATMPGKQFACQMLRLVGSGQCVPAVAKLLMDEQLSHPARMVLLGLNSPAAGNALRQALGNTQGKLRIGIINTIGDRGDSGSLDSLAALLTSGDEVTVESALAAIGKIGGTKAADTLDSAKVPDPAKQVWAQTYLRCAGGLATRGETARAQKMYQTLLQGNYPSQIRAGAFQEIVAAQKERAVPMILTILRSSDKIMKNAAVSAVISTPGHATTTAFGQQLATLEPEIKAVLIRSLASRGDAEGLTELVHKCAADENPAVREAAIKALGRIGNASSVPVLVAALKDSAAANIATQALTDLRGNGVVNGLIAQVETGDPAARASVLGVLATRKQTEALPIARKLANNEDAKIRQAASRVIMELGAQEDLQQFCEALLTNKDSGERDRLARTITAIGRRLSDKARRDDYVLQLLAKADAPAKIQLLAVLASFGGDKALQAIRGALADTGEVHKAAVSALADWPDSAPLNDLRKVAKEDQDSVIRILALRGSIKMTGASRMNTADKVQAFREAMALATRPEEKRQVLSEIGNVSNAEALKIVEPCLDDNNLKREAWLTYERIAESLVVRQPAVAKEALQKVVSTATDSALRDKARTALEKIK